MTTETETRRKPAVELFRDGSTGPTAMKLTWCVARWALDGVARRSGRHLHVLLVSVKRLADSRFVEVGRRIAPLTDGAAYPEFTTHGEIVVLPFLAFWTSGEQSVLGWVDLDSRGRYEREIIRPDGSKRDIDSLILGEAIHFNVPAAMFAKPPSSWFARWANWFFHRAPRDQCQFRKRALFAVAIQPFLVLAHLLVLGTPLRFVVASVLTFGFGSRGVGWSAVLRPWSRGLWGVFPEDGPIASSVFSASPLTVAFTPLIFAAAYFVATLYCVTVVGALTCAAVFVVAPAVVLPLAALVFGGVGAVFDLFRSIFDRSDRKPSFARELEKAESIVCTDERAVLPRRRSFNLLFADTKARVCRPFPVDGA